MPVRNTLLSLIPKHYYRTSIQRQIRCCGVLLTQPEKKEGWFQSCRDEFERFQKAEEEGKTWSQFKKEMEERQLKSSAEELAVKKEKEQNSNEVGLFSIIVEKFRNRFPRTVGLILMIRDGIMVFRRKPTIAIALMTEVWVGSGIVFRFVIPGVQIYQYPKFIYNIMVDFKKLMVLNFAILTNKRSTTDLNLDELYMVYEVFIQIRRMVPVFLLAALPFGNVFMLIIAYKKPMKFLSPHFWNDEQKATFAKQEHAKRVQSFQSIIQYLDVNLPNEGRNSIFSEFRDVLTSNQDGHVPSSTDLMKCRHLFKDENWFGVKRLPDRQLDNLLILHRQRGTFVKINYLEEWGSYMYFVDRAIERQGGVTKLFPEQLKKYCYQRGVNADVMTVEEMQDYLSQWIGFSEQISSDYMSLLLHAPALFGYNHKSNGSVTGDNL